MDENTLLVCPLSELFYQLKRATESFGMDIKTFPSVHIAQAIIQKDVYEYTKDISCEFHEDQGNGKYCPLSRCVRWAYIISDSCCLDLSIEMKPGRHLPMNADTALCNTTEICDTSSYISNQMDNCSVVSGSDLTHVTNPKMQKLPKSHYDSFDDKSKVFSHSRGLKGTSSTYDSEYGRKKIKYEYPALGDSSMKYETSSTTIPAVAAAVSRPRPVLGNDRRRGITRRLRVARTIAIRTIVVIVIVTALAVIAIAIVTTTVVATVAAAVAITAVIMSAIVTVVAIRPSVTGAKAAVVAVTTRGLSRNATRRIRTARRCDRSRLDPAMPTELEGMDAGHCLRHRRPHGNLPHRELASRLATFPNWARFGVLAEAC